MLAKTTSILADDEDKRDRIADATANGALAATVETLKGQWFIVTTLPNHENIAASHLIARRFGIYQPRKPSTYVIKGRKRDVLRAMAPGYLFVFVWGIEQHFRKILSVPGVSGILPTPVPDKLVDRVREEEHKARPIVYVDDVIKVRKRRKKYTQVSVKRETVVGPDEIVSIKAYDAWAEIAALAEPKGIGLLHTALGLAS